MTRTSNSRRQGNPYEKGFFRAFSCGPYCCGIGCRPEGSLSLVLSARPHIPCVAGLGTEGNLSDRNLTDYSSIMLMGGYEFLEHDGKGFIYLQAGILLEL